MKKSETEKHLKIGIMRIKIKATKKNTKTTVHSVTSKSTDFVVRNIS